jgi:hypothetical protein
LEIIFTGGSATVERLFAKAGSSVKNVLKKAGNLADDVFAALTHLIDQIKKGANNFAAYVKKIIDDFFKWLEDLFRSGKADEVFDTEEMIVRDLSQSDLDWMASRKIGNLGGKILSSSQIRKLRGILKQKGIDLIVEGDLKSVTKLFKPVDDFRTIDDLFYAMNKKGFPGGFNAHTKQFYLSKNATEIVAFHEMAHLKHFEQMGKAYLTLSKLEKETFVWEQILANRGKWTKRELKDSLKYINIEREKAGIKEPLKKKNIMKHTEQEILETAKKVLQGIFEDLYKESDIEKVFFIEKDELIRGENEGEKHPTWTASIKAPFDNTDFLTISDETGEPLYYQNFNMIVYEIGKDNEGNYYRKEN